MTTPNDDPDTAMGAPPPDVTIDAPPELAPTVLASTQVGEVRADRFEVSQSGIGRVVANEVHMSQGAMGLVRSRSVDASEGAIGAIAAEHVEVRDGVAILMIARRVTGDVNVLLDWRSVVAAVGAWLVLGRLLRGRR